MPYELPPITPDPVIDAYKPGIDMTLVRENLKLTPTQRLEKLMALQRFMVEARRAGDAARAKQKGEETHAQATADSQ